MTSRPSKHRVPHTFDLYRRTFLNKTIGSWYFRSVLSNKKKPQKTIVISFDPDERADLDTMPFLLDELKKRKMRASFAAVGAWVTERPALWKRVIREGHEIINHTETHPDSAELNPNHYHELTRDERRDEIRACHETVKRVLGVTMKGFRTPHFGYQHTHDTCGILRELGYTFSTSTLAIDAPVFGEPYVVDGVTEFPLSPCPRHPWALFDSSHAFRGRFLKHPPKSYVTDFEALLDSGVPLNIYLDPQDFKQFDVRALLDAVAKRGITTTTYGELLKKRHTAQQRTARRGNK